MSETVKQEQEKINNAAKMGMNIRLISPISLIIRINLSGHFGVHLLVQEDARVMAD